MPLIRSESWAFIWQPKVVTWYRRTAETLAAAERRTPFAAHFSYFANSIARDSRITVTLIWPGYSS
jgi:hypothetical protein